MWDKQVKKPLDPKDVKVKDSPTVRTGSWLHGGGMHSHTAGWVGYLAVSFSMTHDQLMLGQTGHAASRPEIEDSRGEYNKLWLVYVPQPPPLNA